MTELVKVGSEGKYIDLMVDWSFKKIFGTEVVKSKFFFSDFQKS